MMDANLRKFVVAAIFALTVNPCAAEFIVTKTVDEMTDVEKHIAVTESENIGSWGRKAVFYYRCGQGRSVVYIAFPDYLSDNPKQIEIRFDKKRMKRISGISGSTNKHAIFIDGDGWWLIKDLIASKNLIVRAYDNDGISKMPYTFDLLGASDAINKVDELGGCKAERIAQQKKAAEDEEEQRKDPYYRTLRVQIELMRVNFYPHDAIDGKVGKKTKMALLKYCKKYKLNDCSIDAVFDLLPKY